MSPMRSRYCTFGSVLMRIDAACWHGLDPDNVLMTTANPVELFANGFMTAENEMVGAGAVLASEYERDDVNTFASLAKRRVPSAILSETTRGRPERSARYNDFLAPFGLPHEMRTAMVTRGRAWGGVIFHRTEASGDFTPADAALMRKLSRPIAEAMRNTLRFDAARRSEPRAPGMLVLNTSDDIEMSTPGTDALLDLLRSSDPVPRTLPASVLIIAAQTRAAAKGGRQPTPLNAPAAHGWITLHGSVPTGPPGRVAVVIQTTPENEAAPLRLETFALSQREREIAALIAQDLDTASIAERLFISPWTVQDHCKAIFERPPRTPDASSVPSCSSTTICRRSSYEHRSTPAATSKTLATPPPLELDPSHQKRTGQDKERSSSAKCSQHPANTAEPEFSPVY